MAPVELRRVGACVEAAVAAEGQARDPDRARSAADRRVVHLIGRVDAEAFDFLGPVTTALAHSGVRQAVVLFDDAASRHLLTGFHEEVELVVATPGPGRLRGWWRWLAAARDTMHAGPLQALHLHGVVPCLLGTALAHDAGLGGAVLWSPWPASGLRPLPGAAALLLRLLGPLAAPGRLRAVARRVPEAAILADAAPNEVALVEGVVGTAFFEAQRREAPHPLIVTSGREDDCAAAEVFAQTAVLLGGDALQASFVWLGAPGAGSLPCLTAAEVRVTGSVDEGVRASNLSSAWIYLAPGDGGGDFARCLAEAMAVGLPCLALDTPRHRELIRPGETGYLWRTEDELLRHVAALIDEAGLRERLGTAAREEAWRRFSQHVFRNSLFSAYLMPPW